MGHSYGGVVIPEAGSHPNVAALAYIAAFAPDKGESVSSLIADPPPGPCPSGPGPPSPRPPAVVAAVIAQAAQGTNRQC